MMEVHIFVQVFALLFVCAGCSEEADNKPVVHTKVGEIRGVFRTLNVFGEEMKVEKYLGNNHRV